MAVSELTISINHESYDVDFDDSIASYEQFHDDIRGESMHCAYTETLSVTDTHRAIASPAVTPW